VDLVTPALVAIAGFALGSIPFGVLVGRRRGVDVTREGSGNIGATNVARTAGKRAGVIVLVADITKGVAPMLLYLHVLDAAVDDWWLVPVGLAPVLGHCFSPWLKLRGGKGVATSFGVFAVLDPVAALIAVAVFAGLYAAFRVVSISSMIGAASIVASMAIAGRPQPMLALAGAIAVLIIGRHHQNLRRLFSRSELPM
jgi:glycerol-3-phosphate acyltransferase PlsY